MFLGVELAARARQIHADGRGQAGLAGLGVGAQRNHPVPEVDGFFEVVGHKHNGQALLAHQACQFVLQAFTRHRVECAKRLVHQQQRGRLRQAARNLHPLLHTTRELGWELGRMGRQTHRFEHLPNPCCALRPADSCGLQCQAHIGGHCAPGQQGAAVVLKHKGHLARGARYRLPGTAHHASAGRHKTGSGTQQCGLAAAGRANHTDELAALHAQGRGRQDFAPTQVDGDAVKIQQGHGRRRVALVTWLSDWPRWAWT